MSRLRRCAGARTSWSRASVKRKLSARQLSIVVTLSSKNAVSRDRACPLYRRFRMAGPRTFPSPSARQRLRAEVRVPRWPPTPRVARRQAHPGRTSAGRGAIRPPAQRRDRPVARCRQPATLARTDRPPTRHPSPCPTAILILPRSTSGSGVVAVTAPVRWSRRRSRPVRSSPLLGSPVPDRTHTAPPGVPRSSGSRAGGRTCGSSTSRSTAPGSTRSSSTSRSSSARRSAQQLRLA